MKKQLTSLLLSAVALFSANAEEVTVKGGITSNTTWTAENTYLLDGFVFVESGATLTIEAGTVIKGMETPSTTDNTSALIVARGAKIDAVGNALNPIVFTSELDDVTDPSDLSEKDKGLWGGVIVLGYGKIAFGADGASATETNIEGIPTEETRAVYGGTNDADNSGTLKYVSIRHGGAALSADNEINGLTLGGVGSGTTIDYVEVYANDDDGIEWFGGAVKVTHAVVSYCGDDSYDFDFGWRGAGQFWLSVQGDAADNAGEHDGAKPDGEAEYSNPTIYNATYIGSGSDNASAKNATALKMRDNTAGTYANSIFFDFVGHAVEIEDLGDSTVQDSRDNMENGELNLLNNIWYKFGADVDATSFVADNGATDGIVRPTSGAEDSTAQAVIDHLNDNGNVIGDPGITRIDPRPSTSGIAYQNLASIPSGFETTTYKGAFGDVNWAKSWTALVENGHIVGTSIKELAGTSFESGVYPNPATNMVSVSFENENAENVKVAIMNINGSVIAERNTVSNTVNFDISNEANGVYLVKVYNNNAVETHKVVKH